MPPSALTRRTFAASLATLALASCGLRRKHETDDGASASGPAEITRLVDRYADEYGVPRELVHRVVKRESGYNPAARNGPYYGLMQIHPQTAYTMGFRGDPSRLLDAETNLTYGVRYLRGAWIISDGNQDKAVAWYARGYYYEAKRRGLLEETGLRS
jgi:soluble lytic murein transglycosylase-like protein